jgi:hypothetical protein
MQSVLGQNSKYSHGSKKKILSKGILIMNKLESPFIYTSINLPQNGPPQPAGVQCTSPAVR